MPVGAPSPAMFGPQQETVRSITKAQVWLLRPAPVGAMSSAALVEIR
jgi:hypothetical protein